MMPGCLSFLFRLSSGSIRSLARTSRHSSKEEMEKEIRWKHLSNILSILSHYTDAYILHTPRDVGVSYVYPTLPHPKPYLRLSKDVNICPLTREAFYLIKIDSYSIRPGQLFYLSLCLSLREIINNSLQVNECPFLFRWHLFLSLFIF